MPKPPIFDKDGQPWLEACSADGKVYYFNAKTRETKWERPDTGETEKKKEEQTGSSEKVQYVIVDYQFYPKENEQLVLVFNEGFNVINTSMENICAEVFYEINFFEKN